MFLRFAAAATLFLALLVLVKEENVLQRAGLVGSCQQVATPYGNWGEWWACRSGRISGRTDLTKRSCDRIGVARGLEYWRCPATVASSRARL
jgi:hypothetical protein